MTPGPTHSECKWEWCTWKKAALVRTAYEVTGTHYLSGKTQGISSLNPTDDPKLESIKV